MIEWTGPVDSVINKIYWGNDNSVSEANYAGILSTSNTSYKHTGLIPGQTYYYRIMSCSCECSELSDVVSAVYQPAPNDVNVLSGTVTVNGAPIGQDMLNSTAAATVTATEVTGANQGNRVNVNPDGSYQMALFPGTYSITVDYWFRESSNGTWIDFGSYGYPGPSGFSISSDTVQNVDIPLQSLTGTVTDAGGNPVPNVELSYSGSGGHGSVNTSAEPGLEGVYKLYFLPGTYSMQVTPPVGTRFVPFSVGIDIPGTAPQIVLQEQHLLSGTVTVNGAPIGQDMLNSTAAATVTATEVTGANQGNRVNVNPDGSYQMALFPGTYSITVDYWFRESSNGTWIDFGSYGYPGPSGFSISGDIVQNVDIPLHSLTGTVTDAGGNPVPNVELSYSGSGGYGFVKTSAEPGLEGVYKLYFLPGTYGMQVAAPAALFPPFQIEKIHIAGDSIRNIVLGNDCDVLDQTIGMISPGLELHMDICDVVSNGVTNKYNLGVSSHRELMQTILNWTGSEMQFKVYRPDGTLYDQYQSDIPPVVVDIPHPEIGNWTFEVASSDATYENQPVALVAGFSPNQLPVANANGPYFGTVGTPITLDAGNSFDPDGNIVLYEWDWENDGVFDESTSQPNIVHTWHESYNGSVRLRVTDSEGLVEIGCATVEVVGNTPPDITVSVDKDTLWPPNHKMVPVAVDVSSSGQYDTEAICHITSVSSNEPEDGLGDSDTAPDWVVTEDLKVNLRAERSGSGDGRIYTITVECTDPFGNATIATTEVNVPHDLGKKKGKK